MFKLLTLIAPFIIGRVMGGQPQGPSIIEKVTIAYRRALTLTLVMVASIVTATIGLVMGSYALISSYQTTGYFYMVPLAWWGVGMLVLGLVGAVVSNQAKMWDMSPEARYQSKQRKTQHKFSSKENPNISDLLTLLVADIIDERRAKRQYREDQYRDEASYGYTGPRVETQDSPNYRH